MLLIPSFAMAHVTANPDNAIAGSYLETAFRVSHGCEGSETVSVSITLPKEIVMARPQPKSGWSLDIEKSKLEKPASLGHGKMTDERVDTITWKGGSLPDAQFDTFSILFKVPDSTESTLWFPVRQICKDGEINWNAIPKDGQRWHDLKTPAPFVKSEPAAPSPHKHH